MNENSTTPLSITPNCKNCGHTLNPENSFCPNCGGRKINQRLTLKSIAAEISERYFDIDNRLIKTFINLFNRPQDVIDGYINGVRRRYVPVTNYYALCITLTGLLFLIATKVQPELFVVDESLEGMDRVVANMTEYQEYQAIVNLLMLPFTALISLVVFIDKRKYNYTEQLVLNAYATAHIYISIFLLALLPVLMGVDYLLITNILGLITLVYYLYVFKALYAMNWWHAIFRMFLFTIGFLVLTGIITLIVGLIVGIYMAITGDRNAVHVVVAMG